MAKKSMFVYNFGYKCSSIDRYLPISIVLIGQKRANVKTNDESVLSVTQAGQHCPIRQEPAHVK